MENKINFHSRLTNILKATLMLVAIIWGVLQIAATVAYQPSLKLFYQITNFDPRGVVSEEPSKYSIDFITNFLNTPFFIFLMLISFAFAILGTILLTRQRTVYSAVGLFTAFILPKERVNWGIVKDTHNHSGIPFATIRAYKKIAENSIILIEETIADNDGRYRIHLHIEDRALYHVQVEASGYEEAIIKLDIPIISSTFIDITEDISLSRLKTKDLNTRFSHFKPLLYRNLMWLIYFSSLLYVVFFIYYVVVYPDSYYGIITLCLFSYSSIRNTFIVKERLLVKQGRILTTNKKPVNKAFVRIFSDKEQLQVKATDKNGLVRFNLEPGNYSALVSKPGFKIQGIQSKEDFYMLKVEIKPSGFLANNIYLEQTSELAKADSGLYNPFAADGEEAK